MAFNLLPQGNFSLYAIPLAWALAQYPNLYAISLIKEYGKQSLPEEVDSDAKPTRDTTTNSNKDKNNSKNDTSEKKASTKTTQQQHQQHQQHLINPLTTALFGPAHRPDAPRSTAFAATLTRILPPTALATYERAKAAHANALENLPLFFSALILGNLPFPGGSTSNSNSHSLGLGATTMNAFAGLYLLSRVAYTYFYIAAGEERRGWWMARSGMFHSGVWMCFGVVLMVAKKVRLVSMENL